MGPGWRGTIGLGIYLLVLGALLSYFILKLWPRMIPGSNGTDVLVTKVALFWKSFEFEAPYEIRLILIVLVAGALGSYIHAATSFIDFVGNRRLLASWVWWYILRPFIGMALALIFYFVIRGGLIFLSAEGGDINPYGIAAVAGLVGMFSKQGTDKLKELFDNLFKTEKKDERMDKLENPVPNNCKC